MSALNMEGENVIHRGLLKDLLRPGIEPGTFRSIVEHSTTSLTFIKAGCYSDVVECSSIDR